MSGLTEAIGGPRGEHAVRETSSRGGRFWTAARIVLALTCLTLVLHWVQKSPCRDGAWQDLSQYTNFCYTDVLALYYAEGLNQGKVPYFPDNDDHQVEYPVLTGAFMGLIGLPIHELGQRDPALNQGQAFYDVTALALMGFAVATVAMLLSLRRRRPWDAAMFALSPALLVTATVNWDFLAIVLAIGGLWCWARNRPLVAGILLGLGAAAKLWPGFLLGPIIILAIRHTPMWQPGSVSAATWPGRLRQASGPLGGWSPIWTALDALRVAGSWLGRWRSIWWVLGGGIGAWLVTNVPVMLLSFKDWYRFIELNQTRAIDWGTFWYIGRYFDGDLFGGLAPWLWGDTELVTRLALVLFLFGCISVAALGLRAKTPPRLAQLAFLVIAIFLVTSKVWSQQFNLWLLPLIVLARPKWGAFLFWQITEVVYFLAFYLELMGASGRQVIPEGTFVFASILRMAGVVVLIVFVVREILHPSLDVVRQTYRGDPDIPQSVKITASEYSSRWTSSPATGAVNAAS